MMSLPVAEHRISSIDGFRQAVAGASLQLDQLTSEPVIGTKLFANLGDAFLSFGAFSGDIFASGSLSDSDVTVGILLSKGAECRQWYRELEVDDFIVCPAGVEQQAVYSGGASYAALTISEERIADFVNREMLDVELSNLRSVGITEKCNQMGELLRQVVPAISSATDGMPDVAFGNEILDGLLFSICGRMSNADHDRENRLPHLRRPEKIVSNGISYIKSNYYRPVTIHELSSALGVPRRSLVRAFISVTSLPPASFIRVHRLNGVRRMLLNQPTRSNQTVTQAATYWGFTHLGRFALHYKELFDEHPSATLRNSQNAR